MFIQGKKNERGYQNIEEFHRHLRHGLPPLQRLSKGEKTLPGVPGNSGIKNRLL
jgi:hypothetical protein